MNEHYQYQEDRKQKCKDYALELKNDLDQLRVNRENLITQDKEHGQAMRKILEKASEKFKFSDRQIKKNHQKNYVNLLDNQMTQIMKTKMDRFKMTKDEQGMNIGNLQAWKNEDDAKIYSAVPGWVDNTYKRQFFQKVPKKYSDDAPTLHPGPIEGAKPYGMAEF